MMDSNLHAASHLQNVVTGDSIEVLCVAKVWGREGSSTHGNVLVGFRSGLARIQARI